MIQTKNNLSFLVTLILMILISIIFILNFYTNKETILDEVKLKENKVDKKSFAIMIQKEDKTGYEVYEEATWPTNMIYNGDLSGCIDNYGKTIENSLSYNQETNKVTIHTAVTTSCYLYFDLDKEAPIVSATVNNNSTNATITISSNEAGTYCVNTSSTTTNMSNCTFSGNITKDVSVTTSIFSTGGEYYVHVKDSAGNIGISSIVSISIGTLIGEYLLQNPSTGLNTSAIYGGMYRYIGTTANNYVKLSDGTNEVLYRIIGITTITDRNTELGLEAGQIKVIKAENLGDNKWHSNSSSLIMWEESELYQYLNDLDSDTTNQVLNNTNIIPSGWKNYITSVKWNIGKANTQANADEVIAAEGKNVTISNSKIGLIYVSDYYFAYIDGGTQNCSSYSCKSWINPVNEDIWTISYTGYSSYYSAYSAYIIRLNGLIDFYNVNSLAKVRPVFYLDKDVYITNPEATGTSSDPFILSY